MASTPPLAELRQPLSQSMSHPKIARLGNTVPDTGEQPSGGGERVNARAAGDGFPVERQFLPGKAGVLGDKDSSIDRRMEDVLLMRTCGDDRDLPAVSGRQSVEHLGKPLSGERVDSGVRRRGDGLVVVLVEPGHDLRTDQAGSADYDDFDDLSLRLVGLSVDRHDAADLKASQADHDRDAVVAELGEVHRTSRGPNGKVNR